MMLSSSDRSEDVSRCRQLGVATQLVKGIKCLTHRLKSDAEVRHDYLLKSGSLFLLSRLFGY
jgi:hypothetical protein